MYIEAMNPIVAGVKFITCGSCKTPLIAPTSVTSRPSRIQVIPSAHTISQ